MTRNVTIDPLARAIAVEKPEITEVMSLRSGRFVNSVKFITGRRYETIIKVRNWLRDRPTDSPPRLVCSRCRSEVYLVASPLKAFFFRHHQEDGSCPAITRHWESESEIRAGKYAGVQESEAHKRVKRLLMRSIAADARFSVPAEERTWKGLVQPGRYRRPDVSAKIGDLWVAFEAQLSTTFLSVVAERRAFYRNEGGLLVWVLSKFDPNDRRLTEDDLLFSNNSNVLVVDDETAAASEAARRLMLKVHYRVPNVRSVNGGAVWAMRLAGFDELTVDLEGQRAFLVDVDGDEREHVKRLEAARLEERRAMDHALREEFLSLATCPNEDFPTYEKTMVMWENFRRRFAVRGIELPSYLQTPVDLYRPLKALMSAREGVPHGWKFHSLVQVAHQLYSAHPRHLLIFGFALKAYGREELLTSQDVTGKWQLKAARFKSAVAAGDPKFEPDLRYADLLEFLFPEPIALAMRFITARKSA